MVVKGADHIITCTKTAQENFMNLYHIDNVSMIRNGFDSDDFEFLKNQSISEEKDLNRLEILYYGRLSPLKTRINNLLQAMSELKKERNNISKYIQPKLKVIGNNSKEKLLRDYPDIDGDIDFISYQPHNVCLENVRKTDILLLLATNMKETEFFPAKIYEYIKSRKPILAVVTKKGELTSFLESYGNSFVALEDDIENLKKNLIKLMELKKDNKLILSENFDFINQHERKNQTGELVKIIEKISK